jgi:hypothetical protein
MILVAWILLAAAGVAGAWWTLGRFVTASPRQVSRAVKLFVASFAAMASLGLLAFGRVGLLGALIGAVILTAMRIGMAHRPPDPLAGDADAGDAVSTVETEWITMQLDRSAGDMTGSVRRGQFAGRSLGELSPADLQALRRELTAAEPASLPLIDTWLDRVMPGWREQDEDQRGGTATFHTETMDEAQALDILGLRPGAGKAEIEAAYRRVMAQVHPDKGGSNRLASLVNAARTFLLDRV